MNALVAALRALRIAMIFIGSAALVATVVVARSLFDSVSASVPVGFALEGRAGTVRIGAASYPIEVPHAIGYLTIQGDSRGITTVAGVVLIAALALSWLALTYLLRLVKSAAQGEPLERGNDRRVRRLGWIAIAIGVLRTLYLVATYLFTDAQLQSSVISASLRLDLGLPYVGVGVILLALGEVFRRGISLQLDHDLAV